MAKFLNSLLARLVLSVLGIHLLLAPILYIQLARITHESETELFVNDVRAYARLLSDLLEFEIDRLSQKQLEEILDNVVLSRDTVFASLGGTDLDVRSRLVDASASDHVEDFSFGEHGDDAYFLSVPLQSARYGEVILLLGFDERQTTASLREAGRRIITALAIFLGVSLILVILLSILLARPLRALQTASQMVAEGRLQEPFEVGSNVSEVRELADDLNNMRAHLVRTNERLSTEVAERDDLEKERAELETSLRHVQKIETIGTLAGGIAHEFNNVLQPMKFYAEIALDDAPERGSIRADLGRVLESVERAKNLVEQILTFSRRSHAERFELLDLGGVTQDVGTLCRDLFPASVNVNVSLDPQIRPIFADATLIHQLLMNLCSNAFRSLQGEKGEIAIDVSEISVGREGLSQGRTLAPGDYVRIEVSDTGHGMDPLTLERIFEPFFTTRGPREGTGLGLSVAHGIVTAHGGSISARSDLGVGSCVSVCLPVAGDRRDGAQKSSTSENSRLYVATQTGLRENRILAEENGFTATSVGDGQELRSVLEDFFRLDGIVVLDLDGGELWDQFANANWSKPILESGRILVIIPLDALLHYANLNWSEIQHVIRPYSSRDFRSAIERLVRDSDLRDFGVAS